MLVAAPSTARQVDTKGNVHRTSKIGGFLGMSPNMDTVKQMQQELEESYQEEQQQRARMERCVDPNTSGHFSGAMSLGRTGERTSDGISQKRRLLRIFR